MILGLQIVHVNEGQGKLVFLNKRSKADFTVGNIFFTNISEGRAFLLQGVTNSDGVKLRRYNLK